MSNILIHTEVNEKVHFADADPMGVLYHGNYARYFELARDKALETLNYSYLEMEKSGFLWPVVKLNTKFIKYIKYNQFIKIQCELVEWETKLVFNYRMYCVEKGLLAKGQTTQVPYCMKTNSLQYSFPDIFKKRIEKFIQKNGMYSC